MRHPPTSFTKRFEMLSIPTSADTNSIAFVRPSPILARLCYKESRCRADFAEGRSQSQLRCVSLFWVPTCMSRAVEPANPAANPAVSSTGIPRCGNLGIHDSSDDERESKNCHLNQIPD